MDQVGWVADAVRQTFTDPVTAAGVLAGAVLLGLGAWAAARRFWWRPVLSVLAGISLGVVLGVTFFRSAPSWALTGSQFCHFTGFSLSGPNELLNVVLFVPLVFFAALATYRPVAVLCAAVALSAVIEVVQPLTGRGMCETQDFLNNGVGALVAAGVAAGWLTLRR
ncbi:hypothetical protein BBK82_05735 [Lentzea guizhouensis]|uniref:VanZ-like domain-containing protein n=1 Tax=Lentzea guizhouensis TaxID=1586287 RepID=A0A1B2HD72_9PSEU|nr:VanZ family protein [Lentzea guizhouensis]ANZ35652.1 hypothetical protein BBK82_05735 [Lentzea guizhouensis]